jgi:hypothetical protein
MIARILRQQAVVADQVEISLARDYRRVGELESWWGEAWLSTASHVLPGDELTLEVSGGVATPIVIERVTVDSTASRMLVRFTGSGPLDQTIEETGS